MAENKRKKLLGDNAGDNVSLVQILLIPKHNEEYMESKRKELKDREVDGCTFKPQTLDYQTSAQKQTSGDKCLDLNSLKPSGWIKDKVYKTSVDYEFERNKEDCTFKPQINDAQTVQEALHNENVQQIRGVDKVVDRMQKARQQLVEKKLITERGMPNQLKAALG